MPPANTICAMSVTTVSGSTWLLVCASDDTNRPRIADATHVAAMPTNSSSVGLPNRFASGNAPLPIVTISTRMADWITAIAPNTAILAARYADVDSPTACSWRKMLRSPTNSRTVSAVPMKNAPKFIMPRICFCSNGAAPLDGLPRPASPATASGSSPTMNGSNARKMK